MVVIYVKEITFGSKTIKKTGIIFISIDDNEVAQLKCICDEIFNTFTDKTRTNCLGVLVSGFRDRNSGRSFY